MDLPAPVRRNWPAV